MGININYFHNNINILSMNKLLEKQLADEVLNLEMTYSNLYQAYISEDKEKMHYAITFAIKNNPFHLIVIQNSINDIFIENYGHVCPICPDWRSMPDYDMKLNTTGCMNAISNILAQLKFYETNYTYAQSILFQPNHVFTQEEVLYQNNQGQQFKVANLLSVSKYAANIAEAIAPDNKEFTTANAAITTFQSIDAILNNKAEDKPINKMLHLATSFLSSTVKSSLNDNNSKRWVIIPTIMVDLAIDFFVKK